MDEDDLFGTGKNPFNTTGEGSSASSWSEQGTAEDSNEGNPLNSNDGASSDEPAWLNEDSPFDESVPDPFNGAPEPNPFDDVSIKAVDNLEEEICSQTASHEVKQKKGSLIRFDAPKETGCFVFYAGSVYLPQCLGGEGIKIPIRVHVLFPIFWILSIIQVMSLLEANAYFFFFEFFTRGPLQLLMVFVHEMGHLWAAIRCGYCPNEIILWPLGGFTSTASCGRSSKERIYIASMGLVMHFPMALLWIVIFASIFGSYTADPAAENDSIRFWFLYIALDQFVMNVILFASNLLVPCFPLDGSIIMANVMMLWDVERDRMAKFMIACAAISVGTACLLAIIAMITVLSGETNYVLIGNPFYTLGLALWMGWLDFELYMAHKHNKLSTYPAFLTIQSPAQAALREEPTFA